MKTLMIFMLSFFVLYMTGLFASPRWGATAGTNINLLVGGSAANASTVSDTYDTTVTAVYAVVLNSSIDSATSNTIQNIGVGETSVFYYTVYNHSNQSDSFQITLGSLIYTGGASNWTSTILDKNGVEQSNSFLIGPIAEEGSETFAVRIVSSSNIVESPNDGSVYCTVTIAAVDGRSITPQYLGVNDTVYAVSNIDMVFYDTATVSAAVLTLNLNCTGITNISGLAVEPIPGAAIWYQLSYSNSGSGSATNGFFYARIDTANVEFSTVVQNNASDSFTFYYTTAVSPDLVYGTGGGVWTAAAPTNPAAVTYIKWDRPSIEGSETGNLGFKVVIK